MTSPVRRSIKNPTGTRRNFARRDWTSIGLRGARVVLGKARTRTKLGSPGSDLSYAHKEESRIVGFAAPASNTSVDSSAPPRRDWRGLVLIGLLMIVITAAATRAMQ
jgi:Protein of unknown function (DUF4236)